MSVVTARALALAVALIVSLCAAPPLAAQAVGRVRDDAVQGLDGRPADAATRARVEAWLQGLCADVVGQPLFTGDVPEGGGYVDLEGVEAAVRERAREAGRELIDSRLSREVRESYAADFVLGGPAQAHTLLDVRALDDGALHATVWIQQPELDWTPTVWLLDTPEGLRARDWTSPAVGMWMSELLLELHGLERLGARRAFELLSGALGFVLADDFDRADELLRGVPDIELPGTLDSFRHTVVSLNAWARMELEPAERAAQRALAQPRVAPIAHYVRSLQAREQGELDDALQHARRFVETAPGDLDGLLQLGWVQLDLGAPAGTMDAGLTVLAARPGDVEALQAAFLGWAGCDDAERARRLDPLLEALSGSAQPAANALWMMAGCWDAPDSAASLARLAELLEVADCCPEVLAWVRAEVAWWADDWQAIVALLPAAFVAAIDSDEVRESCVELLVEAHLELGDPVAAYESSGDRGEAFRSVARRLIESGEHWGLAALVASYEQEPGAEGDPWLDFVRGVIWSLGGDTRKAELSFARAQQRAGDDAELAELALDERLSLRWDAGDLPGAYDEIEPQGEVLARLLAWCGDAGDAEGLAALLELHADDDRPHGAFPAAEVELLLLTGEDAAAREQLFQRRAALIDAWGLVGWERRSIECLLRLDAFDEALRLARESTARDGDPWFELLVHARRGDVDETLAAIAGWLEANPWEDAETIWWHPELAEDLRGEALAGVAERYPPPEE